MAVDSLRDMHFLANVFDIVVFVTVGLIHDGTK
jgi:hypothetical protein